LALSVLIEITECVLPVPVVLSYL